jgi:predicted AlkP superfamily phosphohydrolase/phosphomutase
MGWLKLKHTPVAQFKRIIFDLGFAPMKVYDLLMRLGFGALKREVVRGRGQGLLKALFLSFDDVDWENTMAYSLGNVGQIRLNVRDREPQGTVSPGTQYETLRAEIMDALSQMVDPETGEHVVEQIYRREDIYSGQNLEAASDILFIPTRMEYFGFGEYEFGSNQIIESMKRGISGTHRMQGIFCMWGEPVAAGQWLPDLEITDLAPTILHLEGMSVPEDMDGKVIVDGLKAGYRDYQVATEPPPASTPPSQAGRGGDLSPEDEERLVKRLRDLGYVG